MTIVTKRILIYNIISIQDTGIVELLLAAAAKKATVVIPFSYILQYLIFYILVYLY